MSCRTFLRSSLLLAGLMSGAVPGLSVEASAQGFDLQQFSPMPNLSGDLFSTASADVAPHLEWSAIALFNYSKNPLVRMNADNTRAEALVSDHATAHLLFSLGLWDRVDLGIDIPLTVWQQGSSVPGGLVALEDAGAGIGDLRLVPKVQLLSSRTTRSSNGAALALLVDMYVPTGDSSRLQGGDFRIGPRLAFDFIVEQARIAANVGYQYREEHKLENLTVRDTLSWNLGLEVPLSEEFRVTAEVFGKLTPAASVIERSNSPTEILLGGKYQTGRIFATAGGGAGLVNGYGTPDFRLFAGFGFAPPMPRAAVEEVFECTPANVETTCTEIPAPSCDGETLVLVHAGCEDNSCTYSRVESKCGQGTICGQDTQGQAACIAKPDCSVSSDCKTPSAPTCKDDTLTTFAGLCEAGTCRYEPVRTHCPEFTECGLDTGEAACVPIIDKVVIENKKIQILDTVHFAYNSDVIEERSFNLLKQVAQVIKNHPEITMVRIEGHTDDRGTHAFNMDLSARRAEAVRAFLIEQRIAPDRLYSKSFGPDRSIQSNKSEAGRAANRRVEFHIED